MKNTDFITKDDRELFYFHEEEIPYISYKCLDDLGFVKNAFTLRNTLSGDPVTMFTDRVSVGTLDSAVKCNSELSKELGTDISHRVCPEQKHTSNVHIVTGSDIGHPIDNTPIHDTDALITDIPGIMLCVSVADCIPICFADPVKKAIGVAHSGRKGTMNRIAANVVQKMRDAFGSDPKDIIATIGPGICMDCYEVGPEIRTEFEDSWGVQASKPLFRKHGEKYLLDLWLANKIILLDSGLRDKNIVVTNICNRCNSDKFYSFRADKKILNEISASLLLNEKC